MLSDAQFEGFTVLPADRWHFAPGINVVIGDNGAGKSHFLKAAYSLMKVASGPDFESSKAALERAYADKFVRVFRPERLGRLVRRQRGRGRCEVSLHFDDRSLNCSISFGSTAEAKVTVQQAPASALASPPVFFPTRELVTLAGWFAPLYDEYHVEFDETYRDTVSLLGGPAARGPRASVVSDLLHPIEQAMGGQVQLDAATGRLYLRTETERLEMPLVAEGHRKFAMIARLIATGVLLDRGYLFWDEPETNLNPRLIKVAAQTIIGLAKAGIQVFVATHSLFLLRELELELPAGGAGQPPTSRFFALARDVNGTTLEQGDDPYALRTIVALDEEIAQSDRLLTAAS